jgi:hypothetical protein
MDLLQRIKAILLTPETEWQKIEQEPGGVLALFGGYVVVLAAIPPVADFLCRAVIGMTLASGATVRMPVFPALFNALLDYVLAFVVVYALALIIDLVAPRFEGVKNFPNALKLATYAMTPYWLAGIFLLIPGLRFLVMFGLYGAWLLWSGLPQLMKSPAERSLAYAGTIAGVAFVIYLAISLAGDALFPFPRTP